MESAKFSPAFKDGPDNLLTLLIWYYNSNEIKIAPGGPRSVMVKAMVCKIVAREFEFESRYYVHFRTNTLGKGMNPFILPAMG